MTDRTMVGMTIGPRSIVFERAPLKLFCKAIGETNPLFTDEVTARAAGHRDLQAPLTYLFALKTAVIFPTEMNEHIGIKQELGRLFHAEQAFQYTRRAYVGDRLTFVEKLIDVYDKKDGELTFIVSETAVTNQDAEEVATLRFSMVRTNT